MLRVSGADEHHVTQVRTNVLSALGFGSSSFSRKWAWLTPAVCYLSWRCPSALNSRQAALSDNVQPNLDPFWIARCAVISMSAAAHPMVTGLATCYKGYGGSGNWKNRLATTRPGWLAGIEVITYGRFWGGHRGVGL